jgi:hypothetical protein
MVSQNTHADKQLLEKHEKKGLKAPCFRNPSPRSGIVSLSLSVGRQ